MKYQKENLKPVEILNGPVDSVDFFRLFWMCLKPLGINTGYNKILCGFYDLIVSVFITICYPLHLLIGLSSIFLNATLADLFKNLTLTMTCLSCSIKHFLLRTQLKNIKVLLQQFAELDQTVLADDERSYFHKEAKFGVNRMFQLFFGLCVGATVSAIGMLIWQIRDHQLMYPGWIPFDWENSLTIYWLTIIYQFIGVSLQLIQNCAYDYYVVVSLCSIVNHIHFLKMRISKIGYDKSKTVAQHDMDFIECIKNHKKLIDIINMLQDTIFYTQLVQFLSSGLILCVTMICLLFYANNIFDYAYYAVYMTAMCTEIFPCCYYGTMFEEELNELPYAIFKSAWTAQTPQHKRTLIIFSELSLKGIKFNAGGFVDMNLEAFFNIAKGAYSMFTLVMTLNE